MATQPRARRAGTVAGVLAGTVLIAVGVGVGIPWAVRDGWSAGAVLGCAALAVGTAWWLVSVRALARGRPSRRGRIGVAAVVTVLTLVLVYILSVPLLVSFPTRTEIGATPASRGLTFESARIPAGGGTVLAAWWVPTRNGAAVVLRHGSGSTRSAVLDQAAVLARHGYGVLLTDARGQGGSSGHGMAWGWQGDADLAAAVSYVAARPGVDPHRIGAVGLSMGGEEALGAAGDDPRIRAVVAEGVTGRSAADLGWLETAYGWRGTITLGVHWAQTGLTEALTGALTGASRPEPLAQAATRLAPRHALLIVAGTSADEQHGARAIAARAPQSVEVWVVPGARHTGGLRTAPTAWENRVTGFLDEALR